MYRLNKSNLDKDKDFYDKNMDWKKEFEECFFQPTTNKKV